MSAMGNLAALLEDSSRDHQDRTAIIFGDARLTYAQLDAAACQVAHALTARGVRPGDKVALSCPNVPQFTIIYYGILKTGAVVVPLNILLKAGEIAYHLADAEAKVYVAHDGSPELPIGATAHAAFDDTPSCETFLSIPAGSGLPWADDQPGTFATVEVDDEETAVILFTSGTTGRPKGAELRHRNLRDNALVLRHNLHLDAEQPDTFLCVLPLFHTFALTMVQNGSIAFGGTVVLLPRFEPRATLDLMLQHKISVFAGVPTMFWGLLRVLDGRVDAASIAKSIRVAISGGAPLPGELRKEFQDRFGVAILEGYGLSETSPVACSGRVDEEPREGSIGRPVRGVEMKLIHDDWTEIEDTTDGVGEIAIKGHNVMKGYYGRPEATADVLRDGWFRTGDLARRDADGCYYIVDRAKDLILRGGYNVYPRELEEVLMTHPAVTLVAVIGVPHPSLGEDIKAVMVKQPGDTTTEEAILAWGKEQFAGYKYPRIIEFADELPMSPTGKILKREIKAAHV